LNKIEKWLGDYGGGYSAPEGIIATYVGGRLKPTCREVGADWATT